mgnify:FL=1
MPYAFRLVLSFILWTPSAMGQRARQPAKSASKPGVVTATLGSEVIVFAPSNFWIDGPYFTYTWADQTYGVLPSDRTHRTSDFVAPTIKTIEPMEGLAPGAKGNWDELGSWLNGIYCDDENVLHGFYHGETGFQPISKARNRAALGYACSRDGGKSWTKPGYPANRIVTGQNGIPYAGDGHVTIMPKALRMYFCQMDGQYAAESSFADCGRPGTWKRYLDKGKGSGSFSVDAMRGNGTRLKGLSYAAFVIYNTYLSQYLAVDGSVNSDGKPGRSFNLKVSDDGIAWSPLLKKSLPLPQTYEVLTLYPSLVGLNGEANAGKVWWLYYVYIKNPNVLDRVKVTLGKVDGKAAAAGAAEAGARHRRARHSAVAVPKKGTGQTRLGPSRSPP